MKKSLILFLAAALVAASASGMALNVTQNAGLEIEPNGLAQHLGMEIDPNGLASYGPVTEPGGLIQRGGLDIEPNGLAQ